MFMVKKSLFIFTALFFLISSVSAYETPDMRAADISGTTLQPYYMSTTEVTQSLYKEITGKNPSSCVQETAAFSKMLAGEEQDSRPVESVTFFDAMWFCNQLTEKTLGKDQCVYTLSDPVYDSQGRIIRFGMVKADFSRTGYRLPTREEWQNAAGSEPSGTAMYAWFVDNSAARGEGRTGYGTHAVAKKLPDAGGLYDMYGNVAEMCHEGETLGLCIMGTAWNRLDEYYTDGYVVDYLYGYSQYTVSRNHARESFAGFSTCGFRLCRSISDLPFTLTGMSVPDVCDTYDGIVPVTITGSGFLCRRTDPLTVRVEGFSTETAGSVNWLSDSTAVIPVQAEALKIEGSQQATLRVILATSRDSLDVSGTVTRIHTEFPVHPADVLLDDGTVVSYEKNYAFTSFEKEHAAAVILYAPYDGTQIYALGLKGWNPAVTDESPDTFFDAYGARAGIFGSYLGSGWHLPTEQELTPLADAGLREKLKDVLGALEADAIDLLNAAEGDGTVTMLVPVKNINTRGLITQKYEYLTANNLLKEAAEQEALLKAMAEAEAEEAAEAERAARAAEEAAAAERAAREAEEAARLAAEEEARAQEEAALLTGEGSGESMKIGKKRDRSSEEFRTLIGFGFDTLETLESTQTVYAELSTGLFVPFLYLSAEGNATVDTVCAVSYWDAALSLGLSVRMHLGSWHPDLFVSGGAVTNEKLLKASPYVSTRLEAGVDLPLARWLSLTARYTADLNEFRLDALMDNYRLTAGISFTF